MWFLSPFISTNVPKPLWLIFEKEERSFSTLVDSIFMVLFARYKGMNIETEIADESVFLLPEKAIFWPRRNMLILADAHLGKAGHFRKNGIALPSEIVLADLVFLEKLIHKHAPKTVLFLGDLFHSAPNQEWDWFAAWLEKQNTTDFILVKGNHDTHLPKHAIQHNLRLLAELKVGPFLFTHEPLDEIPEKAYNLCGHIHPGVRMRGKGRQSLRLPCFWFGKHQGILPAFGNLTGSMRLKGKARVFAVADGGVFAV